MTNTCKSFLLIFLSCFFIFAADAAETDYRVKRVDFLPAYGLEANAAGPLLVTVDQTRNRIILVNTNTCSISVIDGNDYAVTNIPIGNRVPQYLKSEALTVDKRTGNIYVIGNKSLHIAFPDKKTAVTVATGEQYEMAAVNEKNGAAFLVGRAGKFLLTVELSGEKPGKIKRIPWVDKTGEMANLNQTPPPPIRKVVCDSTLQRVIAIDGFTAELYLFSTNGKLLKKRKLPVKGGSRWHWAGYNETTHHLYVVIETAEREVKEAVKNDVRRGSDTVVELPGLTEGVGISYNPAADEVYIPYDNHPSVHVVDFKDKGRIREIAIPTYGNDACAVDEKNNRLYVASWGYGEVEVIDLKTHRLLKRIRDVGIIPHMFGMAFHSHSGRLFIPIGATAVNGSFGASLTVLDPESEIKNKIYTGWAPTALAEMKTKDGFLVFNSEDRAAEVTLDNNMNVAVKMHSLPAKFQCRFVNDAVETPTGNILVSYGPHQSYWPVVYIWAAKNGVLGIDPGTMSFYDRRIPRLAQQMVFDKNGVFYALQNNWGKEKQFLISLPDEIRSPNLDQMRVELEDSVVRETTQRILEYDEKKHWLYIVRVGETDKDPGILQIFDPDSRKVLLNYPTGLTPVDLVFDDRTVYISNFDSDTIAAIDKEDFSVRKLKTGRKPFKLAILNNTLYCIDHNDNTLRVFGETAETHALPYPGKPSNLFAFGDKLIITGHSADALHILCFHPGGRSFQTVHKEVYPYGETTVATNNSAFYLRGQFADGIFEVNQIKQDKKGRLWITDYLSGKLFIIYRSTAWP